MNDPGLQPQRTSLAWNRTPITLLVLVGLLWRAWARQPDTQNTGLLVAAVLASASALTLIGLSATRSITLRRGVTVVPAALVGLTAASAVGIASAVIIAVWT